MRLGMPKKQLAVILVGLRAADKLAEAKPLLQHINRIGRSMVLRRIVCVLCLLANESCHMVEDIDWQKDLSTFPCLWEQLSRESTQTLSILWVHGFGVHTFADADELRSVLAARLGYEQPADCRAVYHLKNSAGGNGGDI